MTTVVVKTGPTYSYDAYEKARQQAGLSVHEVGRRLGDSASTIDRKTRRWKETGLVEVRPGDGLILEQLLGISPLQQGAPAATDGDTPTPLGPRAELQASVVEVQQNQAMIFEQLDEIDTRLARLEVLCARLEQAQQALSQRRP